MKAKSELWGQKLWLFIEVSVRTVSGPTTPAGARRAYECTRTQRAHTHTHTATIHMPHILYCSRLHFLTSVASCIGGGKNSASPRSSHPVFVQLQFMVGKIVHVRYEAERRKNANDNLLARFMHCLMSNASIAAALGDDRCLLVARWQRFDEEGHTCSATSMQRFLSFTLALVLVLSF